MLSVAVSHPLMIAYWLQLPFALPQFYNPRHPPVLTRTLAVSCLARTCSRCRASVLAQGSGTNLTYGRVLQRKHTFDAEDGSSPPEGADMLARGWS